MVESTNLEETKKVQGFDPATMNDVKLQEFKIVSMRMKDADKGEVLWEEQVWDLTTDDEK